MRSWILAVAAMLGAVPAQAVTVVIAGRMLDVGVLATGRYGDIVAVMRDPLSDVAALEHVDPVIKDGVLVKGAATK